MWKFLFLLPLLLMACAPGQVPVDSGSVSSESFVSSASSKSSSEVRLEDIDLVSGDERITIHAEKADTPGERALGLMNRKELPRDQGMFFIFEEPQEVSFWMKNTLIPLDILFFGPSGAFISRTRMEPCVADPCRMYPSNGAAKFALEVNPEVVPEGEWRLEYSEEEYS